LRFVIVFMVRSYSETFPRNRGFLFPTPAGWMS